MLYLIEILHQTTTNRHPIGIESPLYLIEILHQTTTLSAISLLRFLLYLIEILHQTTTLRSRKTKGRGCILSKFYIKPQHVCCQIADCPVVSYRNSTSNHNIGAKKRMQRQVVSYRNSTSNHNAGSGNARGCAVVSYRNSTSNHNRYQQTILQRTVVSYRNSTSNHNYLESYLRGIRLYLIEILHQTTTPFDLSCSLERCILSKFYIKPQQ